MSKARRRAHRLPSDLQPPGARVPYGPLGASLPPEIRALDRLAEPLRPSRPLSTPELYASAHLNLIEDRRRFDPLTTIAPPRALDGRQARLTPSKVPKYSGPPVRGLQDVLAALPSHLAFEEPRRVAACVRRQNRKEVLHALDVAGRSGVGRGRRRAAPLPGCK